MTVMNVKQLVAADVVVMATKRCSADILRLVIN